LGPHDNRLDDLAFAHSGVGGRLLDGGRDHVADAGVAAMVAALHPDAEDLPGTRVVSHPELGLLLDHLGARSNTSSSRQRLVLDSGRDSTTRTTSPRRASLPSSCALSLLVRRTTFS